MDMTLDTSLVEYILVLFFLLLTLIRLSLYLQDNEMLHQIPLMGQVLLLDVRK